MGKEGKSEGFYIFLTLVYHSLTHINHEIDLQNHVADCFNQNLSLMKGEGGGSKIEQYCSLNKICRETEVNASKYSIILKFD
jgi:hypothetical protein